MALATNSTPGSIVLGGDLTGNANAPELRPTGVTPGEYVYPEVVVDAKGRVVYANDGNANESSTGVVQIGSGIDVSSGVISVAAATNTTIGGVKSADTDNITIVSGEINTGTNIPRLDTENNYLGGYVSTPRISIAGDVYRNYASMCYYPNENSYNGLILGVGPSNAPPSLTRMTLPTTDSIYDAVVIVESTSENEWKLLPIPSYFHQTGISSDEAYGSIKIRKQENKYILVQNFPNYPHGSLVSVSDDLVEWSDPTTLSSNFYLPCVYGSGKFVLVTSDLTKVAYSTDGNVWTEVSTGLSSGLSNYDATIAYGNSTFVVTFRGTNKVMYSSDGINWSESTISGSSTGGWSNLIFAGGKFIAVNGSIFTPSTEAAYSTDGILWTPVTMPASAYWSGINYYNGRFMVVEYRGNGPTTKLAYSTDGITWSLSTLPANAIWNPKVAYGAGKWILTASHFNNTTTNKMAYSTDGISWTGHTLPSTTNWYYPYFVDSVFIVLTRNSYSSAYSTNGTDWTTITCPINPRPSSSWDGPSYDFGDSIGITALTEETLSNPKGETLALFNPSITTTPHYSDRHVFSNTSTGLSILTCIRFEDKIYCTYN